MAEKVTIDSILNWLTDAVEHKVPVGPHTWVDAAQKLTVLLGDEHDKLFEAQSIVARQRLIHIEAGDSVALARTKVEADIPYKEMQKQKAKIGRIEEMVRIAKIQARLKDNEYGSQ